MSGSVGDVAKARTEALAARQRLNETMGELQHRLDPRVKARETWAGLREQGREVGDDALEFAYEKPRLVAAGAAAFTLLLLRRPLLKLGRSLFNRAKPVPPAPVLKKNPSGRLVSLPGKGGETR